MQRLLHFCAPVSGWALVGLLLAVSASEKASYLRPAQERQASVKASLRASLLDHSPRMLLPIPETEPVSSYVSQTATALVTQPLIIGGIPVTDQSTYPYFVTTQSRGCGATLIHPDIILTAAHCQETFGLAGTVHVGAVSANTMATAAISRTLVRQYPHHTDQNPEQKMQYANDLMVFVLNAPVMDIEPISLNADPAVPAINSTLTVLGFGATSSWAAALSLDLRHVDLATVPMDQCVAAYQELIPVDPTTMLCAAELARDSCRGDSGGPLLDTTVGQNKSQVGIVSFGRGCGDIKYPGVYTRISTYNEWIRDRVCELSVVPPDDCPVVNKMGTNMKKYTADADALAVVQVTLHIEYDSRSFESFWRLLDKATGEAVASQPELPVRGSVVDHVLYLQAGKPYTFQMTDTRGDGICCNYGNGRIVITASTTSVGGGIVADTVSNSSAEGNVQVSPRSAAATGIDILAESDGDFGYSLSLEFLVPSALANRGVDIGVANEDDLPNLVPILVVLFCLAIVTGVLAFSWRRFSCFRK